MYGLEVRPIFGQYLWLFLTHANRSMKYIQHSSWNKCVTPVPDKGSLERRQLNPHPNFHKKTRFWHLVKSLYCFSTKHGIQCNWLDKYHSMPAVIIGKWTQQLPRFWNCRSKGFGAMLSDVARRKRTSTQQLFKEYSVPEVHFQRNAPMKIVVNIIFKPSMLFFLGKLWSMDPSSKVPGRTPHAT